MQRRLSPECKKSIGLQAISENNISHIARLHQVCRNTVYTQKQTTQTAVNEAFMDQDPDNQTLFHLPVTKAFLHQVVLGILLICKGSYRSAQMFLHDLFDTDMCIGTIFNIHSRACHKAAEINASYDLGSIRQSASDEIYHRNRGFVPIPSKSSLFNIHTINPAFQYLIK